MSRNDPSPTLYRFDITAGQVTAVFESEHGQIEQNFMDAGERYTVEGLDVLQHEQGDDGLEITRYTDVDGDGWYVKSDALTSATGTVSAQTTWPAEKYRFDVQQGQVVAVYETEHGRTQQQTVHANETYTVSGTSIVKTETGRYGQEVTTYTDADGNGLFVKTSAQWLSSDATPGHAAPTTPAASLVDYTFGDDDLEVHEGRGVRGGEGADTFTVHGSGAMAITDFDHTQGDRLTFATGLGIDSFEELLPHVTHASYDGHDFHLELDQGMALTLVGVNVSGMSVSDLLIVS